MTTTDSAPETERREFTHDEWAEEARARFGDRALDWAFVCPRCGDVATAREFPAEMRERIGQECIGRHRGVLPELPAERGCDWAAYGLIPAPWSVTMPDGKVIRVFRFAPAPPQPPQSAPHDSDGTPGPEAAERPAPPLPAPACALSVERRAPGMCAAVPGDLELLDPEDWDYRVALGEHQAVLGYRDFEKDVPVTLLFADTSDRAARLADWTHRLDPDLEETLRHIDAHELPITKAELTHAVLLIVEACAQDGPRVQPPVPSEPFLTGDDESES